MTTTDEGTATATATDAPVGFRRRALAAFWPHGALLTLIVALAAVAYAWGMGRDALEPYYEASVRSMSGSAHDFLYGAFDPAGTITLDKLPGALWVQAVFVALFGFHTWAMVLPQVIEGALAVVFLYRAVARLAGRTSGLVAAAVLAISPAVVALDRGNIGDTLMILLLVLAADATSAAVTSGRTRSLVLAGVWVGLAFQAKMIQAWLILPALALAYLISGPGAAPRRLRQLGIAGLVTGVASLAWVALVSLTPAGYGPYVDGSTNDTWWQQIFVYNGLNRLGGETPLQTLAAQGVGTTLVPLAPAAPWRLLVGYLGLDTGWLLLAAIVVAVASLLALRRRPWTDPRRAGLILWTSWLVVIGAAFSVGTSINPYYTAALAPAVAAIIGIGVGIAWSSGSRPVPLVVGGVVVVSVAYAGWLLPRTVNQAPDWLRPAAFAIGVVGLAVLAVAALRRRRGAVAAGLVAGLVATCFTPAVAAVSIVARHQGAFDTPFEPRYASAAIDNSFIAVPANVASTIPGVENARYGAPYLLATQTAIVGSFFIDATGEEALPIGGFSGTAPVPTLAQVKSDVCHGLFHLVLVTDTSDPRLQWIAENCQHVGTDANGVQSYFCLPGAEC